MRYEEGYDEPLGTWTKYSLSLKRPVQALTRSLALYNHIEDWVGLRVQLGPGFSSNSHRTGLSSSDLSLFPVSLLRGSWCVRANTPHHRQSLPHLL